MGCIVWTTTKARASKDDTESEGEEDKGTDDEEMVNAMGTLMESEKREIRSLSLAGLLAKDAPNRNEDDGTEHSCEEDTETSSLTDQGVSRTPTVCITGK